MYEVIRVNVNPLSWDIGRGILSRYYIRHTYDSNRAYNDIQSSAHRHFDASVLETGSFYEAVARIWPSIEIHYGGHTSTYELAFDSTTNILTILISGHLPTGNYNHSYINFENLWRINKTPYTNGVYTIGNNNLLVNSVTSERVNTRPNLVNNFTISTSPTMMPGNMQMPAIPIITSSSDIDIVTRNLTQDDKDALADYVAGEYDSIEEALEQNHPVVTTSLLIEGYLYTYHSL